MTSKHAPAPTPRAVTMTGRFPLNDATTELMFAWHPEDPHAVTLTAAQLDGETVEWMFARDLLIDYHDAGWAGECDLRIYTDDDPGRIGVATLHFKAPDGEAWVDVSEAKLRAFAFHMKRDAERYADHDAAVVAGDLDATLHAWCGGA